VPSCFYQAVGHVMQKFRKHFSKGTAKELSRTAFYLGIFVKHGTGSFLKQCLERMLDETKLSG
jgi:hypothetical protein